jgi:hypothetical protein
LIKEIADLLKKQVSADSAEIQLVRNAYNSHKQPQLFNVTTTNTTPLLRFGSGQVHPAATQITLDYLQLDGLYRQATSTLRIALVSAIGAEQLAPFCKHLQQELAKLKFEVEFLPVVGLAKVTRASLEEALPKVKALSPQLVLGFFTDNYYDHDERKDWDESAEEDNTPTYQHFKALTMGQGLPSQVIYTSSLAKPAALHNIVLGILGKTGNIPFVLADPLPYADLVVGIDIARRRKERLAGTINAAALARIYANNGDFIRYAIHDAPLEGETIPSQVLQSLFPINDFSGKRVVVHRDGYFRGDEKKALKAWGTQIGTEFLLVEIIKTGAPRLYATGPARKSSTNTSDTAIEIQQPPKGSALLLSNYEAFVVSGLPPFANATPQPLHLRTEAPFNIAEAIHSVLTLTLLHYGSASSPRLPVTIHYSDKIAYLALNGHRSQNLEGNIPYWL